MTREEEPLEVIIDELGRRVVVALNLVDDHFTFFLQLLLRIGTSEDDIHQQRQGTAQVLAQEGGIVDGLFLARVGIQFATHALHAVQNLNGSEVASALEGHVFYQMCHTTLAVQLMARTGRHGDTRVADIGGRGFQEDARATKERIIHGFHISCSSFQYLITCQPSTRPLVNSSTHQLVNLSTCPLDLWSLDTSRTRQLINSSTRQLVNSSTRQLVYSSTHQL